MSDPRSGRAGRTRYLINPAFQFRFVGIMIGVAALAALALYVSNALFMAKIVAIGKSLGLPDDHPFWRFIGEQQLVLNSVFWFTAAGVSVLIVVVGMVISHRIAGPIYRMQTHLDEIARTGEVKELSFREKDYFPEMAGSINRVMQRFSDKSK